jgi:hypothetical protein
MWLGVGLLALLSATTLAIDVGQVMVARAQAQTAADAGAVAGATALALDGFTDRTASGPAVRSAIDMATTNLVVGTAPSVQPADVSFPLNPSTHANDEVKVQAYRTTARGNPLPTLLGNLLGTSHSDISVVAIAQATPANAETCVLPFTIPDKWIENSDSKGNPDGPWLISSTFDINFAHNADQNAGAPLPNPDVYVPPGQMGATGYNPFTDKGLEIVLKTNIQNKITPTLYTSWDLPGSIGPTDYRNNIVRCNTAVVQIGDYMTPEKRAMVVPMKEGTDALIATDPTAYWDTQCRCVKGSAYTISPRVGVVPLYNPTVYAHSQHGGKGAAQLQITNYLGFFIESVTVDGDITGRITPITGLVKGDAGPATGAFPRAIRLVQ